MSIFYIVCPLDSRALEWSRSCGLAVGTLDQSGRSPTFEELKSAVVFPGHHIRVLMEAPLPGKNDEPFQIAVDSERTKTFEVSDLIAEATGSRIGICSETSIRVSGGRTADDRLTYLSVRGDVDLMIALVRNIVRICGPQFFMADCESSPWLVLTPTAVPYGAEPWTGPLPETTWPEWSIASPKLDV